MASSFDPYSWIQKESYISPSQEQILDNIPGWDDAKLDGSLSPGHGIPGPSENRSLQLGCESSESDSGPNQREPYRHFPRQQTVEIASPDDFSNEKQEESYNPAFESDRSQSPNTPDSLSLPNVAFVDIPSVPYLTQVDVGLTASQDVPESSKVASHKEFVSSAGCDPTAAILPACRFSPPKSSSKLLPCKVETQVPEYGEYCKRLKRQRSVMEVSAPPKVDLHDKDEGELLPSSSPEKSLKRLRDQIVEEVLAEAVPALKCKTKEKGKPSAKASISSVDRREAEYTQHALYRNETSHKKRRDIPFGFAEDNRSDSYGNENVWKRRPDTSLVESRKAALSDAKTSGLQHSSRKKELLLGAINRKKVAAIFHEAEGESKQSAPSQLSKDREASEQIPATARIACCGKSSGLQHSSKTQELLLGALNGNKAAAIFDEADGKSNQSKEGQASKQIPGSDRIVSARCEKDSDLGSFLNLTTVSGKETYTEMGKKVREENQSVFPRSVMDVVMNHSGSLPPIRRNTDFRTIAMNSGLSLPPPFGSSHLFMRR